MQPRKPPPVTQDAPRPARTPLAYRFAIRAALALAPLAARWSPKLAAGLRGRRESAAHFARWGADGRDPARPLLLVHAASAGELRQVEPVLHRLRQRHPDWQLVVTCFSPSGLPVAAALGADLTGLLPWDTPDAVATLLDQLRPTAIVLTRAELWPELLGAAAARGVRLVLLAATVPPGSHRLRWPARALLARALGSLDAVGATTPDDAARLLALGARPGALKVTGDPRADAVLERLEGAAATAPEPNTLVAGSTWPADEAVLLTAFRSVRELHPDARLLLAPHEPTPAHLAGLRARARAVGLGEVPAFGGPDSGAPVRVVEGVGGLALLYGLGRIAYVGGGLGGSGLHSVLEPAAAGVPILVGAEGRRHPDAIQLNEVGALEWLPRRRTAAVLEAWWATWLTDPAWCRRAGASARECAARGRGAADRSAALVEELLGETTRGGPKARP